MKISCDLFWRNFMMSAERMPGCYGNAHLDRKIHLKFGFPDYSTNNIMWIKNTVEHVDWIFLNIPDQSNLVKFVFILHNKCLQADIAHKQLS